jgi:hypothetical protein
MEGIKSKLCRSCKGKSTRTYCPDCRAKLNELNQKRRLERKNCGLCTECGKPAEGRRCRDCYFKERTKNKERLEERAKAGKCYVGPCPNRRNKNTRFCDSCAAYAQSERKSRMKNLMDNELCSSCGQEKYLDIYNKRENISLKFCQTCYLKQLSRRHIGNGKYWKELLNILVKQDFKCPYTGDTIILAMNDSIDHILPRKKYPEKQKDINNFQWVTRTVNNMKYDLLEYEFLSEIVKIVRHLGDGLYRKATP